MQQIHVDCRMYNDTGRTRQAPHAGPRQPLHTNFKNWESADGKEKKVIRIADLMTHTSGLPPYAPVGELEKQYGFPQSGWYYGIHRYLQT